MLSLRRCGILVIVTLQTTWAHASLAPLCSTYKPSECIVCRQENIGTLGFKADCPFYYPVGSTVVYACPLHKLQIQAQSLWALHDTAIDGLLSFHESCPLVKRGTFVPHTCPMHELLHPPDTSCTTHCCQPGDFIGSFAPGPIGRGPGHPVDLFYHSNSGCRIHSYTMGSAVNCLIEQHGVRRIIMGGDSLMRQQFMRLVSLLRHQTSTLDIGKWASVRYRLFAEPDGSFSDDVDVVVNSAQDAPQQRGWLREPHEADPTKRRPIFEALFFFLPYYLSVHTFYDIINELHTTVGPAMYPSGGAHDVEGKTMFMSGCWYWEDCPAVSLWLDKNYTVPGVEKAEASFNSLLRTLEQAKNHPWLFRHVVFNTPTKRMASHAPPASVPHCRVRNRLFAEWAKNQSHIMLIDYDALSYAPIEAPGEADLFTHHYGCEILSQGATRNTTGGEASCYTHNTHFGCTDVMNTVLLQIVFNTLCNGLAPKAPS